MLPALLIDKEFKSIIPPLNDVELSLLEESLKRDGCREPIRLWNGIIVDGHNRYEICSRLGIPFTTSAMSFQSRADVISWICLNQLSRRNLTGEAFRYLIGKRYDAEKLIAQRRNAAGNNQYYPLPAGKNGLNCEEQKKRQSDRRTSVRIGSQYNLNHSTVESYGRFSRSLDQIERKSPGLLTNVLAGSIRMSKDTVDLLADMPAEEIGHINRALNDHLDHNHHMTVYDTNRVIEKIQARERKVPNEPVIIPEIKKMPAYDPDAGVNGLLLTVPTWISTIKRITEQTDFALVSDAAKDKLARTLRELESAASGLQHKTGGCEHGH